MPRQKADAAAAGKKKSFSRLFAENKYLWGMALIPVLYYVIFCYVPMYGVVIAFENYSPYRGIFAGPWVGFKYFTEFFHSIYFFRLLRNTILLNVYSILWGFPAPIILALVINSLTNRAYKKCVQTISYLPHFISTVIVVGIFATLLSTNGGIVNKIITACGGEAINFFAEPEWFRTIYISSGIWQSAGWDSIIYLAALSGVDPQLYEAATVDGATKFKQLIYITVPSILPTVIILLILRMGNIMSVGMEKVLLMYSPLTYSTADVINTYVYRVGIGNNQMSYGTAVGLFQSAVNFIIIFAVNRISRKVSEISLW